MANIILDNFGKKLVDEVRDNALEDFEMIQSGRMRGEEAEHIRHLLSQHEACRKLFKLVAPYAVDKAIHKFLAMFEADDSFHIISGADSDSIVDLNQVSDGLAGELYGEGWIKKYSRYPHSLLGREPGEPID